jgi:hypothetical protein
MDQSSLTSKKHFLIIWSDGFLYMSLIVKPLQISTFSRASKTSAHRKEEEKLTTADSIQI